MQHFVTLNKNKHSYTDKERPQTRSPGMDFPVVWGQGGEVAVLNHRPGLQPIIS